MATNRAAELQRREDLWTALLQAGGPERVQPGVINALPMYRGQRGIYRDKDETRAVGNSGVGVTVGLMHKGDRYPDDLDSEGMLYHYPVTSRPGTDRNEIEATKDAGRLSLPVFVVTVCEANSSLRDVRIGWVADWDDDAAIFYVPFQDKPPTGPPSLGSGKFEMRAGQGKRVQTTTTARPGQAEFRYKVLKRYGARCAVCDVEAQSVLDAVHIYPKRLGGSDDPRNGLVLCALHHRAFDAGLLRIKPNTGEVVSGSPGHSLADLHVQRSNLGHIAAHPHVEALTWAWENLSD